MSQLMKCHVYHTEDTVMDRSKRTAQLTLLSLSDSCQQVHRLLGKHTAKNGSICLLNWAQLTMTVTFCRPTSRGNLCVPPNPGNMPRESSGSPSFVPGVHKRALQAMAVSQPPPRAMPSTAATVGFGPLSRSSQKAALILLSIPPPPDCVRNCWMSKPAENRPPWPVTTIALTSERL